MNLKPVIISAPFGNYLEFEGATSTVGTYTWEYRGGFWYRLWRVLRTVRYYPRIDTWVNKLGLPNPGMEQLLDKYPSTVAPYYRPWKQILSISARDSGTWFKLFDAAREIDPLAVELNVSCPNCGDVDHSDYDAVFGEAVQRLQRFDLRVIVKLPPVGYLPYFDIAAAAGIRYFHCCNTLPTPAGGLSGKALKPVSLACLCDLKRRLKKLLGASNFRFIGGGGITSVEDAKDYLDAGADHVSIGSMLFFPWRWRRVAKIVEFVRQQRS